MMRRFAQSGFRRAQCRAGVFCAKKELRKAATGMGAAKDASHGVWSKTGLLHNCILCAKFHHAEIIYFFML